MPTPRDEQHTAAMIEGANSTARLLGLGEGPTYEGTAVLTIGKAEQAQLVVEEWFTDKLGLAASGGDLPILYQPGHEGAMWALSLEGVEDWTLLITQDPSVKWPPGVFAEPVTSWCLGLYPLHDNDLAT